MEVEKEAKEKREEARGEEREVATVEKSVGTVWDYKFIKKYFDCPSARHFRVLTSL